ncbi:cysteine synthase A [Parvularcula sp. IMCC14364]|uniref:cysteine synthase A n=1 Tax=Parvularcula sp. IMCC14364 TaxID=3067902 RepID=UPI0027423283|nr:cysteine synthase A [Parvularcula sp. IMCC14364]
MKTFPAVTDLVGNTPLIRLKRASEETGCTILGKAEFLNPGQSVKDRAALGIIRDAEQKGTLKPGGMIVEGTAGNTGIGLCVVGKALGYEIKIVMPRTQSEEKKQAVRQQGGTLIEVDAVPYANPDNYVHYSGRLAEEMNRANPQGAIWANQFDNTANRDAHYLTTGPEIWRDLEGKIDGFICAVGSGGTLGGVSMALKERKPETVIGIADPYGAKLFSWYKDGILETEGASITEGIGQGRVTANLEDVEVNEAFRVSDAEALQTLYKLVEEEGMFLGGSAGINIAGAVKLARQMGPGHTIVTILCDYGNRYGTTFFNPEVLQQKGLPLPPW